MPTYSAAKKLEISRSAIRMDIRACLALIGLTSVLSPSPSDAAVINSGFETGDFSGWTTIGNTSIQTSAYGSGPTEGTFNALLSTGDGAVPLDVETFLGLTPGSLDGLGNGETFQGSAIKQTFAASAGQVLSFNWNFLTSGTAPVSAFNDFSFVTIGSLSKLADTFSASVPSFTSLFDRETEFQTFSYTIPTTGTYSLGIGVIDAGDAFGVSGLLVDKVVSSTPVPEPTFTFGVLVFGVGMSSVLKRKQQQKS